MCINSRKLKTEELSRRVKWANKAVRCFTKLEAIRSETSLLLGIPLKMLLCEWGY